MKISMMREGLEIGFSKEETKLTVVLKGRLDTSTSPELEMEMIPMLRGVTELTVELAELEYITSAGLRVLLKAVQIMKDQGEMTVMNPNSEVREVFEITGFNGILTIKPEIEAD